jgi:hypothetical protein
MVMVGVDVHKYNHCAQAVDEVGRRGAVLMTLSEIPQGCSPKFLTLCGGQVSG